MMLDKIIRRIKLHNTYEVLDFGKWKNIIIYKNGFSTLADILYYKKNGKNVDGPVWDEANKYITHKKNDQNR